MRSGLVNPRNGRRQELAPPDGRFAAEGNLQQRPAFQLHVRRSLRMHPVLGASVAATVFLLLVGYALSRKPVYQAETLIYIEPFEVRVLNDGTAGGYDPSRYDSYLQQQVQTVERADTLEAALAKLPPGMWSTPGDDTAVAVKRLQGALKVERVLNSYQLAIDVTAGDPAAAAAASNAIATAYLEAGRKDEHARADQRLQLLNEERQRITDDMTRDKAEQAQLGNALGVARPSGEGGNPYDMQTAGLRSQLDAARESHDAVSAQLSSLYGGSGLATAANELIVTDPGLVSIKQTLSQRRAVLSDQMAGLTQANPVYKQDQEEIAEIDRSIERATADARGRAERQLQDKLRLDMRRTADVEARLNAQLAEQTAKATGAGPKLQRAAELDTDLQRLSARFATVDDAIRGLQLETGGPGQAHLALPARVPDAPQPSRKKFILLLALPLALLCGIAAAVLARKRDRRLYVGGDVEEVLGFAPMCVLPNAGEVGPAAYDDFLLRLAGGLEGAYRHSGARSFVFTPVDVGAGESTLLPQLCAKLRQLGFRASCARADELLPTAKVDGMNAAASTTSMERLLDANDMVLVHAPPLLGSALTEYAVRSADATILLVESAGTRREDLQRAAVLLERLNPQGIGAVVEDMPLHLGDSVFRDAVQAAGRTPLRRRDPMPAATPNDIVEDAAQSLVLREEPAAIVVSEPVAVVPEVEAAPLPVPAPAIAPSVIVPAVSVVEQQRSAEYQPMVPVAAEAEPASSVERWEWQTPPARSNSERTTGVPLVRSAAPSDTVRFREAPPAVEKKTAEGGLEPLAFRELSGAQRTDLPVEEVEVAEQDLTSGTADDTTSMSVVAQDWAEVVEVPSRLGHSEPLYALPAVPLDRWQQAAEEEAHTEGPEPVPSGLFARLRSFFGFGDEPRLQMIPSYDEAEEDLGRSNEPVIMEPVLIESDPVHDPGTVPSEPAAPDFYNAPVTSPLQNAALTMPQAQVEIAGNHDDTPSNDLQEPGESSQEPIASVFPETPPVSSPPEEPKNAGAGKPVFTFSEITPDQSRAAIGTQQRDAQVAPVQHLEPFVSATPEVLAVTFARPRSSPLTVAAIPSVVTSVGSTRVAATPPISSEVPLLEPRRMPAARSQSVEARTNEAPSQRRGLAKALAYAAQEDGPPARASEGIAALRSGAGLRKAVVRQEAALRSGQHGVAAQPAPAASTRRWAMLSRFGREDQTDTAVAGAAPDDPRNPDV